MSGQPEPNRFILTFAREVDGRAPWVRKRRTIEIFPGKGQITDFHVQVAGQRHQVRVSLNGGRWRFLPRAGAQVGIEFGDTVVRADLCRVGNMLATGQFRYFFGNRTTVEGQTIQLGGRYVSGFGVTIEPKMEKPREMMARPRKRVRRSKPSGHIAEMKAL